MVGIDIGSFSTKALQLRYEAERAILETYGELKNDAYLEVKDARGSGLLRYQDHDLVVLVRDILQEAKITARDAAFCLPASASFVIAIPFPKISLKEIESALPFEAGKYIPIPLSEVVFGWDILESNREQEGVDVLLAAVPRDMIEKVIRVAHETGLMLRWIEVESFSLARALVGRDSTPTAILDIGQQSTTVVMVDHGKVRSSYNLSRGSQELTQVLETGLAISRERAEAMKREMGLSEKIEEREIVSIMTPLMETLWSELERVFQLYNRRAPRKIQKIIVTGGGSQLKGIVEAAASRFGIEVARNNPFSRLAAPGFMQVIFREIGPSFPAAIGLALHEGFPGRV